MEGRTRGRDDRDYTFPSETEEMKSTRVGLQSLINKYRYASGLLSARRHLPEGYLTNVFVSYPIFDKAIKVANYLSQTQEAEVYDKIEKILTQADKWFDDNRDTFFGSMRAIMREDGTYQYVNAARFLTGDDPLGYRAYAETIKPLMAQNGEERQKVIMLLEIWDAELRYNAFDRMLTWIYILLIVWWLFTSPALIDTVDWWFPEH